MKRNYIVSLRIIPVEVEAFVACNIANAAISRTTVSGFSRIKRVKTPRDGEAVKSNVYPAICIEESCERVDSCSVSE